VWQFLTTANLHPTAFFLNISVANSREQLTYTKKQMSHAVWLWGPTGIIQLLVIFHSKAHAKRSATKKWKFQQRTSLYT